MLKFQHQLTFLLSCSLSGFLFALPQDLQLSTDEGNPPILRVYGDDRQDRLGSNEGSAAFGDFNGDGFEDLLVGAYRARDLDSTAIYLAYGEAYVIWGGPNVPLSVDLNQPSGTYGETRIIGDAIGGLFGGCVEAFDFNGDGYDDMVISAHVSPDHQGDEQGEVFIIYGGPDKPGTPVANGGTVVDLQTGGVVSSVGEDRFRGGKEWQLGFSMTHGDVNGDGYLDLIAGTPFRQFTTGSASGGAMVLYGGPQRTGGSFVDFGKSPSFDGFEIIGSDVDGKVGFALASGDINGDGVDDIALGAPDLTNPSVGGSVGAVYVVLGFPVSNRTVEDLRFAGESGGTAVIYGDDSLGSGLSHDRFGSSLSLGDLNGDGKGDLLVGAPLADYRPAPNQEETITESGEAYVLWGHKLTYTVHDLNTNGSISPLGETRIKRDKTSRFSGWAVLTMDWDLDGKDDVVITETPDFTGTIDPIPKGAAFLHLSRSGADFLPATGGIISMVPASGTGSVITGEEPGDSFGKSIAAGDMNGDGALEFVGTSVLADNPHPGATGFEEGAAHVIFGDQPSTTPLNITRRVFFAGHNSTFDNALSFRQLDPTMGISASLDMKTNNSSNNLVADFVRNYDGGTAVLGNGLEPLASRWNVSFANASGTSLTAGDPIVTFEVVPTKWELEDHDLADLVVSIRRANQPAAPYRQAENLRPGNRPNSLRFEIPQEVIGASGIIGSGAFEMVLGVLGNKTNLSGTIARGDAPGAMPGFANSSTINITLPPLPGEDPFTLRATTDPLLPTEEWLSFTVSNPANGATSYGPINMGTPVSGTRNLTIAAERDDILGATTTVPVTFDTTPPTVILTSSAVSQDQVLTSSSPLPFTVTFNDAHAMTTFDPTLQSSMSITNASIANVIQSGTSYQFNVRPSGGEVIMQVNQGAVTDAAGNPSSIGNQFSFFVDIAGPQFAPGGELRYISGSTSNAQLDAHFSVTFDRPIQTLDGRLTDGLAPRGVTLVGSTIPSSGLTVTVTPTGTSNAGPFDIRISGVPGSNGSLKVGFRSNTVFDLDGNSLDVAGKTVTITIKGTSEGWLMH